jgi:electron transfer flavoprotein alpha/beta subunit
VYSLAGRAIIQDKGDKLLMLQTDRLAIETALRLAHAKFGDVLTLTGPREFQDRTARIAAEANIQVTFQDRRLEQIRQHRASERASERAQRAEHRELGDKFIEQQRRPVPAAPAAPKKIEQPAPGPDKKDKDRGPER